MKLVAACCLSSLLLIASKPAVHLKPSVFKQLPANLVEELHRRGCTIPQDSGFPKRQNVVHGEFTKPGQTDWAVLCSQRGVVTMLVFWNGSESEPAQLAKGTDGVSFSREIGPVGREY